MPRTPVLHQISLLGAIPHVILLALLIGAGSYWLPEYGTIFGVGIFLLLRMSLRTIARDHRIGMKLVRRQFFEDAIPHFLRSFDFFDRRRWLDEYRAITLLSPSAISYREMALVNAAFCYSQMEDGGNARKYYEQCLALFPDSGMATSALRMMQAGENAGVKDKTA